MPVLHVFLHSGCINVLVCMQVNVCVFLNPPIGHIAMFTHQQTGDKPNIIKQTGISPFEGVYNIEKTISPIEGPYKNVCVRVCALVVCGWGPTMIQVQFS